MAQNPNDRPHDDAAGAFWAAVLYVIGMALIVFVLCMSSVSCQTWQARRSYSIFVEDQNGRRAGAGVVIEPIRSGK